jgi:hypothetical protein
MKIETLRITNTNLQIYKLVNGKYINLNFWIDKISYKKLVCIKTHTSHKNYYLGALSYLSL